MCVCVLGDRGDQRRQTATDLQQEVETEESARGCRLRRQTRFNPTPGLGEGGVGGVEQKEEAALEKPRLARPAAGPAHPADPQLLTAARRAGPLRLHSPFRHVRGRAGAPGAGPGAGGGPGWG